jgi:chromosome segregation ATPase
MNTQWLEVLSGIDKMVLGSIVGSVVLAFILLVVIFSVKIKYQQDKIVLLKDELGNKINKVKDQAKVISKHELNESDAKKALENYKDLEKKLKKEIEALKKEKDKFLDSIKELESTVKKLNKEKQTIMAGAKKAQNELDSIQNEIDDSRKRNEFWIDQLSELRTKHEALKHKLKTLESKKS